jgi:Tfp pilus assembly protein PilF
MFSKLMEKGFDTHAVSFCRETTKPIEVVRYYNNKGVVHSKSGEADKAITAYKQALMFFPDFKENYRIMFNLALATFNLKTPDARFDAQMHLEECLKLEPTFEKAQKALAQIKKGSPS